MVLLCLFLPALEYNIEVQSSFHTLNANIETSCWVLVLLIIIVTPETGICISNWCGYSSGNSALTFICLRAVWPPPRFHDPGAIWAEQRPCYVIYKTKKHQGEMQHFTLSDKVYRLYYLNTEDPTPIAAWLLCGFTGVVIFFIILVCFRYLWDRVVPLLFSTGWQTGPPLWPLLPFLQWETSRQAQVHYH